MKEWLSDPIVDETKEKLDKLGIEALFFDFDDTLIYTAEIFIKQMEEYASVVAEETGLSYEMVDEYLTKFNDEGFKTLGVNPIRWKDTVGKMADQFPDHAEAMVKNMDILMKIYSETPRIRPGAKAVLEILKTAGVKMVLVTHANVEWTWRKLASTGLSEYFDLVKIVDENKHKGAEDWLEAVKEMGVLPGEALVMGDSLNRDVIPAASIGARTMWLHKGSTWSMYRTGEVPKETLLLDEINQLLSALERLR
jgi:putative hydrolase of the HAD superfamily